MVRDQLQRAVQMPTGLLMNTQQVCSCFGEGGNILVWILYHQVAVQRKVRHRTQRLHHRRPKGDIRDKMSVHHIDVDDASTASLGCLHLIGEMSEVRGQY